MTTTKPSVFKTSMSTEELNKIKEAQVTKEFINKCIETAKKLQRKDNK